MPDLQVVAAIPVKAEATEAVRTALQTLAEASRQEDGCLSYELFESTSVPGTFVTVERWTGQDALNRHMQTPHIAQALAAADGNLTGDIAIHPLVPAGSTLGPVGPVLLPEAVPKVTSPLVV